MPRVMAAKKLDPSCAFGFYCGSQAELSSLLARLPTISELRSPGRSRIHGNQLIEVVSASQARQLFRDPQEPPSPAPANNNNNHHHQQHDYPPIDDDEEGLNY